MNELEILSAKGDSLIVANKILTRADGWQPGQPIPRNETPVFWNNEAIGLVDWKSAELTSTGLWVQRILNRRGQYLEMLKKLLAKGLITTRPVLTAGKSAGGVTISRDVLIVPHEAQKAINFWESVLARALPGELDRQRQLEILRLKQKSIQILMEKYRYDFS